MKEGINNFLASTRMNQRQIKFRAWDKEKKIMVGCEQVPIGMLRLYDPPAMQFTGLLDKNGKEIYEGDILKINGIVKYEEGSGGGSEYGASWIGFEQDEITNFKDDEIIGNIYSNPELIS